MCRPSLDVDVQHTAESRRLLLAPLRVYSRDTLRFRVPSPLYVSMFSLFSGLGHLRLSTISSSLIKLLFSL